MAQETTPVLRLNIETHVFESAMRAQKVLLPDGSLADIVYSDVAPSYGGDVWCDDFDAIIEPGYDQGLAMFIETVVNAGLCRPSGSGRFNFILQNLDLKRAKGDLFDWDRLLIDRHASSRDWRKEKTICDAFSKYPPRDMNRLKEKVSAPRENELCRSKDDYLLWRVCYLSVARKVFLARAGYAEFSVQLAC